MTVRTVVNSTEPPFIWVDVVEPTPNELADVARRYNLHPTSVEDSLEPEHLPKYERIGSTTFIIVRAMDTAAAGDCSTLHEMTRKVAIFYGTDFLVTIHRTEQPFLTELIEEYRSTAPPDGVAERRKGFLPRLLINIVNGAIATYQKPLEDAEATIDQFEATVFGEHEFTGLLRRIYLVKRRVTLMRRMLSHTLDAVKKLVPGSEPTAPLYQDLRENAESMHFYADELLEDVNNLLSIQLALASHRTNEVVRVLTVFSVFFLPLTFIVGIYGMNFDFMPELRQRWGYPAVLAGMGLVTLAIFLWFRRRGWLRG
jgi:magnesium transporter